MFYQDRVVIPQNLRAEMLPAIHTGTLGLNKYREREKCRYGGRNYHMKLKISSKLMNSVTVTALQTPTKPKNQPLCQIDSGRRC